MQVYTVITTVRLAASNIIKLESHLVERRIPPPRLLIQQNCYCSTNVG